MSLSDLHLNASLLEAIGGALGLIVLDALLGVAIAIKSHAFSVQKLPNVVENALAPLGVGLSLGAVLQATLSGVGADGVAAVVGTLAAAVAVRALADVKAKAADLISGASTTS